MKTSTKLAILIISCLLTVIFAGLYINQLIKPKVPVVSAIELQNAVNDTLKTIKDENGDLVYRIKAMETASAENFIKLKTKDSSIQKLQKIVAQYKSKLKAGGSATSITGTTEIAASGVTQITPKDTLRKDSLIYIFPEYKSHVTDNKWYYADMLMNKDSSKIKLSIVNDYAVIVNKDKGLWTADVINYNPYSLVKSIRTNQITIPVESVKRFGIGVQGGYGLYMLDKNAYRGFYIGFGVSYNLIRF